MKLTIYRKLFLSFLVMALLTVLASTYAVFNLHQLNEMAYRIIHEDVVVVDASKKLMGALIAQESAEKRYLILRDPSIEELFATRSAEFKAGLAELRNSRFPGLGEALERIFLLHGQYADLFVQQVGLIQNSQTETAQALSENVARSVIDEMASHIRGLQRQAESNIDRRMNAITVQGLRASRITVLLMLASLTAALLIVILVTYNISRPLLKLEKATAQIAEGQFDLDFRLSRRDEIGSLARAFGDMAQRLKLLEEQSLDASPLTGLPGNRAIEREIEKRLAARKPFSLCQVDLDNFKAFADRFGYAWGSEVIKDVGRMLFERMKAAASPDLFIGHIGGDDFVIIASPARALAVCRDIVGGFDARIRKFYPEEDRERGYFIGRDRQGVQQRFPLVSVTISIVTDDGTRFRNPLEMAETAAELKAYGKTLPGNNYVTERDFKAG
jgi:GGDEF domain-containing protein